LSDYFVFTLLTPLVEWQDKAGGTVLYQLFPQFIRLKPFLKKLLKLVDICPS